MSNVTMNRGTNQFFWISRIFGKRFVIYFLRYHCNSMELQSKNSRKIIEKQSKNSQKQPKNSRKIVRSIAIKFKHKWTHFFGWVEFLKTSDIFQLLQQISLSYLQLSSLIDFHTFYVINFLYINPNFLLPIFFSIRYRSRTWVPLYRNQFRPQKRIKQVFSPTQPIKE